MLERDNFEWQVVRRRKSEGPSRTAARQVQVRDNVQINHGGKARPTKKAIISGKEVISWTTNYGIYKGDKMQKIWENKEGETLTFLFTNFPEDCYMGTLVSAFKRIGTVIDVFCPGKRDKAGKLFRFVRFSDIGKEMEVLEALNDIWIGSFKMRAFIPKFNRPPALEVENHKEVQEIRNMSIRKIRTTFAEAVSGPKNAGNGGKQKGAEILFQSLEEENGWLKNCYSGFMKRKFLWEDHAEEIQSECGNMLNIRSMGGNLILIQSTTDKSTGNLVNELDEWVNFWFEWVRPWDELDVNTNRLIWTRWYGVPMHAWTNRFFALASANLVCSSRWTRILLVLMSYPQLGFKFHRRVYNILTQ